MTLFLRGVAGAALLLLLAVVPAYAHAELEESDPADGETITTPYTLTATFSQEFDRDRSFIRVRDAAGELVAEGGQYASDPTVMTVALPELAPGEYTVQWQTVTADDNGVELDTFTFNVSQPATPTATPTPTPTPTMASTPVATASARAPSATPTISLTPAPTPTGGGTPTAGGNDILLALGLAAVVLLGVGAYVFTRRR